LGGAVEEGLVHKPRGQNLNNPEKFDNFGGLYPSP